MNWIRGLVAGGLSLLLPGAGHALIREWARALLFGGLFVITLAIFIPQEVFSAESVTVAMDIAFEETSSMDQFLLSFIVLFAAIDATIRGLNVTRGRGSGDGPSCPHCGRELDEELDFCHWCTTRIEWHTEPEADLEAESEPK